MTTTVVDACTVEVMAGMMFLYCFTSSALSAEMHFWASDKKAAYVEPWKKHSILFCGNVYKQQTVVYLSWSLQIISITCQSFKPIFMI